MVEKYIYNKVTNLLWVDQEQRQTEIQAIGDKQVKIIVYFGQDTDPSKKRFKSTDSLEPLGGKEMAVENLFNSYFQYYMS